MGVLVTGGAGYIGSHMILELLDAGEAVIVVDDLSTGFDWAVPRQAELVIGDIGDGALVDAVLERGEVDAVIHFAGSIVVPDSVADPLGYYHNNTVKSRALIESCVRSGVKRFIFSSTAAVYGMAQAAPVTEDVPLAPMSPYGTSKLMTEWMLRDCAGAHEFDYVALRYFNVAGADPRGRTGQSTPNATHLIKAAAQAALGVRPRLEIFGRDYDTPDGTCVRDYIHVSDLVGAHVLALAHLRGGGESSVFNCGYGHGYSVLQVIEAVERATGHPVPRRDAPRRAGDPPSIVANADKIRARLGWQPRLDDLDLIVAHAFAWEERLAQGEGAVRTVNA
jgi:UDP-glucose 4-epimerase